MTHRGAYLFAPAYSTMPNTFADEILSRRFKRTAKRQTAADPTRREHSTTLKRAIEETVGGSSSSEVSLRPSDLRTERKVPTLPGGPVTVQSKAVSRTVTPHYENEVELWSRKMEVERRALWNEHLPKPKATAKAWQVRRYLSGMISTLLSILVWPVEKFLSLEPIVQGDLVILAVIGIVVLCTSPGKSDPSQEQSADSQQTSRPVRSRETGNETNTLSRRKPPSGKKQKTRQKNSPSAARDTQL